MRDRVAACRPAVVQVLFGGPTICIAQAKLLCINDWSAPGADGDVSGLDACTAALAALSCEDVYNQVWPRACAGKGVRADGVACIGDAQCASGLCATIDARGCGVCRTMNGAGKPCEPACEKGLVCANDACAQPGSEGMPCSTTAPCSVRYFCGPGGTCTPRGGAGASCSASVPCDASLGVDCATDTMRCTKRPVVQPGAECVLSNGIGSLCSGGQCVPAPGTGRSVCMAFPREGEPCGSERGCLLPFVCVAGQCVLPNQTFCPD